MNIIIKSLSSSFFNQNNERQNTICPWRAYTNIVVDISQLEQQLITFINIYSELSSL